MANTPKEDFKLYCLRALGFPVINLNLDDDQINDRIDEAVKYFQEFHVDGSELAYYHYPNVSQTDIDNRYITLPNDIISVDKVFNLQDKLTSNISLFDLRYQLRLNELWDFTSASFLNYQVTMQHLQTLNILFSGELIFTFNRYNHRLNIFEAWGSQEQVLGSDIVVECYRKFDPEVYPDIYSDRWLRKYSIALIKRMWGANLSKYSNVSLIGGVSLNGMQIYQQAMQEIQNLEDECIEKYSAPLTFYTN